MLIVVFVWIDGVLWVCLSGVDVVVCVVIIKFGGECVDDIEGVVFWCDLCE